VKGGVEVAILFTAADAAVKSVWINLAYARRALDESIDSGITSRFALRDALPERTGLSA
jgi:hypothetical protein